MNFRCFAALAAAASVVGLGALAQSASAAADGRGKAQAVAFQIDAAHSGATDFTKFKTPLKLKWNVNLGGWVSYPLIAGGKVFVTVSNQYTTGVWGSTLYALDLKTGKTVWSQPVDETFTYWSNAAYDNGSVFVVNFDGLTRAFDAETGHLNWSYQVLGQWEASSPPIASNGVVYVVGEGSGGTVDALNEKSGQLVWTQDVDGGDFSAPALGDNGLYLVYGCDAYGLNPKNGHRQWHYRYGCGGGSGETPSYRDGLLYARNPDNSNLIFRAKDGSVKGIFAATPAPALYNDANGNPMEALLTGGATAGGTLYGVHADSGIVAWTFTGDAAMDTAPIAINGQVIVGSSQGNLYVLDGATGSLEWTANVGTSIYQPNELSVNEPLTGLGAGENMLVVPASFNLMAYASH